MTKQRLRVLALAVLVVVLATLGVIVWRRQAELAADLVARRAYQAHQAEVVVRSAQAQARIDALTEQQQISIAAAAAYLPLLETYEKTEREARAAGKTRHDASDDGVIAAQAKKELADVIAMQGMLPSEQSAFGAILDAYAAALGEGAVSALRTEADQLIQTEGLSLNHWEQAIQIITDSLASGGGVNTAETVERLYGESGDDDTRAATQISEFARRTEQLGKQLQGRIDGAKRDLAAIQ